MCLQILKTSCIFFTIILQGLEPKRHLEFIKMLKVRQTKGLNIIRNVKTSWLSMLSLLKGVMPAFRTLVHKMHGETLDTSTTHACQEATRLNFDLLIDVFIPHSLAR